MFACQQVHIFVTYKECLCSWREKYLFSNSDKTGYPFQMEGGALKGEFYSQLLLLWGFMGRVNFGSGKRTQGFQFDCQGLDMEFWLNWRRWDRQAYTGGWERQPGRTRKSPLEIKRRLERTFWMVSCCSGVKIYGYSEDALFGYYFLLKTISMMSGKRKHHDVVPKSVNTHLTCPSTQGVKEDQGRHEVAKIWCLPLVRGAVAIIIEQKILGTGFALRTCSVCSYKHAQKYVLRCSYKVKEANVGATVNSLQKSYSRFPRELSANWDQRRFVANFGSKG